MREDELTVTYDDESMAFSARFIAEELMLPLEGPIKPQRLHDPEYVLHYDIDGLSLRHTGARREKPIRCDFAQGALNHRRHHGGGRGQLIAKAMGLRDGLCPRILDTTAGMGRDAFVLACLGCELTLLERHSWVFALLEDGLARARQYARETDPELVEILSRMQLREEDAREHLAHLPEDRHYDVIYLDPMFPERGNSAAVKKEMAAFQELVGDDSDAHELLAAALAVAPKRVVVKRPRHAPVLQGPAPSHQVHGKSTRFDVYALRKLG